MGEVIAVAMMTVAAAVVVGRWAWRDHTRVAHILGGEIGRARPAMSTGRPGADPRGDPSILIWRRVQLLSVLTDETMAIVACRRQSSARRRPRRARRPAGPVELSGDDRTIVLHLGGGEDAERALTLLQRWCRDGVSLHVQPSPLEGTIELADETGLAALHAPLAAL